MRTYRRHLEDFDRSVLLQDLQNRAPLCKGNRRGRHEDSDGPLGDGAPPHNIDSG